MSDLENTVSTNVEEASSTNLEESLSTEKVKPTRLNKNGKPKKEMTPEALERLSKAREKANAMRLLNYANKIEQKAKNIKEKHNQTEKPVSAPSLNDEGVVGEELPYPEPAVVKEVVEKKVKPKGKKKTKIIVEQSSDDTDEFEPNDNVVFVKRITRKKKEPVQEPVQEPEPEPIPPPIQQQRPILTPEQKLLKSQYEGMFTGNFINQNSIMRRHY